MSFLIFFLDQPIFFRHIFMFFKNGKTKFTCDIDMARDIAMCTHGATRHHIDK